MAGAGFQIPIELKINFLEYVVKPSFGVTHTPEKPRDLWMREFAGLLYGDHLDILMIAFNTIETLQEAKEELEKARAKEELEKALQEAKEELEKARADRAAKREFIEAKEELEKARAKEELEKARAKEELEKARADRAAEREFILQQQRAGTLYFNLMFFLFLYVFFPT
jgi:Fe2+ transport system protein B